MDLVFIELLEKFKNYKRKYNELLKNYNILANSQNMSSNGNGTLNTVLLPTKCFEKTHPVLLQDIKLSTNMNEMSDIVSYIIKNSGSINLINKDSNYLEIEKNTIATESKDAEFRNIMTDFINNEFFSSDILLYNFIKNFMKIMETSLNLYITEKLPELQKKYSLSSSFTLADKIVFILKGGNTLKAIMEKYISEQAGLVGEYIYDIYGKYFKRSDLDFQIVIYPYLINDASKNITVYNEIVEDLKILSCYTLNRFRNTFISNLSDTFNYYKYNNNTKQKLLKKLLDELNSCDFFKKIQDPSEQVKFINNYGEENRYYFNMKFTNIDFNNINSDEDVMINFLSIMKDPTKIIPIKESLNIINNQLNNELLNSRIDIFINIDKKNIIIKKMIELIYSNNDKEFQKKLYDGKDNKSEFYISIIDDIKWERKRLQAAPFLTSFSLVRLKVNFLVNIQTNNKYSILNIPSELIDISIPYFNDHKNKGTFGNDDSKKIKDLFTKYEFSNTKLNQSFNFWSYNINTFIHDLYVMLFVDSLLPWQDKKYKKRLFRILFFSTIQLLSKSQTDVDDIIQDLTQFMTSPISTIISNVNFFDPYLNKNNGKDLGWINIFKEHKNCYNIIMQDPTNMVDNNNKFTEYYKIIFENIDHLINIIKNLSTFINLPYKGKVNVESKDFNKIHQFAGDINRDKYFKYKNKYLQSKQNK
jgi:hypothetical protein